MSVPICECGHLLYEEHDELGDSPCLVPDCKCSAATQGDDESRKEMSDDPFEDEDDLISKGLF